MPDNDPWQSGSDNYHFTEIRGIAFNTDGTVMYVSDRFNHRIQMYDIQRRLSQSTWARSA